MNSVRRRVLMVVVAALGLLAGQAARAQQLVFPGPDQVDPKFFATGSVAWGGTNSWTIAPSVGGRVPVLRTLEVSTDLGPGRVVIFTNGFRCTSPQAVLGGTNIHMTSGTGQGGTNGFAAMDAILIEGSSGTDRIVMLAQVHSVGTTNISTRQSITNLAAGASIWRLGTNQVLTAVTNGATSLRGGQIITCGRRGEPLAIHILGTSSCFINAASGTYE